MGSADAPHGGEPAVELVREDLRPSAILTRDALANAVQLNGASDGLDLGGRS